METLSSALPYLQIIIAVLLIAAILLQQTDASLGSVFGGGDEGGTVKHTRRGFELTVFRAAIILASLFAVLGIIGLFV